MYIAKSGDKNFKQKLYNDYMLLMNDGGRYLNIGLNSIGDNVKVVVPYRTGNGQRSTFYGYMILHAKIIYIEGCRALYHVDSIDSFIDESDYHHKWKAIRTIGSSYFFDYRSKFEVMLTDTYYDKV